MIVGRFPVAAFSITSVGRFASIRDGWDRKKRGSVSSSSLAVVHKPHNLD
jgi:hypothetical protein